MSTVADEGLDSNPQTDERDDDNREDEVIVKTRLDITSSLMQDWTPEDKQAFIDTLNAESHPFVTTIHISGRDLQSILTTTQIETLVEAIGKMYNVTDLFCFQGDSSVLTADLLSKWLPPNLTVLMLWHLRSTPESLAGALRQHRNLCRVTLNFPCPRKAQRRLQWACLDVYAMAFCSMEHLEVLQIRCVTSSDHHMSQQLQITQEDSIITPEALALLLNSTTIQHLYLENCGLLDDHMDVVAAELPTNRTLVSLDLQNNNMFTEDIWYTTGRVLPQLPRQFTSLDISCSAAPHMSDEAGCAVATGMQQNKTLLSLELEGTWNHYQNEFAIPEGHKNKQWMTDVVHQLRVNRAYAAAAAANNPNHQANIYSQRRLPPNPVQPANGNSATNRLGALLPASAGPALDVVQANAANFVVALTSVSDHVSGLYHFLRTYPDHCDRLRAPAPHVEPTDDNDNAPKHAIGTVATPYFENEE
jgi:hypothetical protein